ncbi:hypothetical protein DL93DRAFT_2082968 [Clavulina sp. PMI_390]|nr:hypothetical protein DL93DRAFT_2082968 [Clavulina sp. PMI_390]
MPEYDPTYTRGGDNVLGSATPGPIRHLIDNEDYDSLAELGEAIVNLQLSLHAESLKEADARTTSAQTSLVEQTASKILDTLTGSEEDFAAISGIPAQLAHKAIWESEALPYHAFRTLRKLLNRHDSGDTLPGSSEFGERDIDDWILANERNLRDDRRSDWMRGLVDYDAHAHAVFNPSPETTSAARVIHREKLSGYTFLDELRATSISIQPSSASFQSMFNRITDGLLSGLDWSNVLIAGGIVLSTLVSTSDADIEKYISSDIDVYIYCLDPVAANRKIQHIFDVWKSNLPTASQDKTLVVRNSRTITFFSEYPVKRVQVVLKLVKSPKEVLLNFDLDICAMGYDGSRVVMLPRAARALETGYNVFTMDLIQGHYLGERRASQESRVFKYADKGYGIRILDSYVRALSVTFPAGSGADRANQGEAEADRCAPNLEEIADRAAQWTHKAIKNYRWYIPFNNPSIVVPAVMEMTHSMLEERSIVTSEPGERSCLTSFEVLMRHVELWREEVRGHIALTKEHWATNDYDVGATGYDDSPIYAWGKDFELEAFKRTLEEYNHKDYTAFETSYDTIMEGEFEQAEVDLLTIGKTRRVSFAPEVSSLLEPEGDIILLFFASPGFATFANDLVKAALQEHSLPLPNSESDEWDMIQILGLYTRQQQDDDEVDLEMLKWRINAVIGWQQIDRRIDEVFEILWSFYRAYGEVQVLSADLSRKFFTEVGRRAIRPTPMDEYTAFGRWVMRGAPRIGESYGGMGQGFFGWTDDEEADEEEHVDEPEPAFFD